MRPRSPRTPTAGSLRLPKQCLFFFPLLPARYTASPDPICGRWDIMRPGRPKHQHTKCSCLGRRCKRPPGAMMLIRYRDPVDFFSGLLGPLIYVCRRCDETHSCHMISRKLCWVNSHRRRACLLLAQLCQTPCYHGVTDMAPSVSQPLGC